MWFKFLLFALISSSFSNGFDWQTFSKSPTMLFVRRFGRTSELQDQKHLPNIVEVTEVLDKSSRSEDDPSKPSFTIITRVRSPDSAEVLSEGMGRTADSVTSRRMDSTLQVKSPQGLFSLFNGMVKFFGNKTVPKPEEPEIIDPEDLSQARTTSKGSTILNKKKNGFFSLQNGRIQYHGQHSIKTTQTEKLPHVTEQYKHPSVGEEKVSFTFLPTPAWNFRNRTITNPSLENEIDQNAPHKKAAQRLPTVRVDNETVFVPSESYVNGTILYNKLSVDDFLREYELNSTHIEDLDDPQPTLPSNIPLSQMEVLYPGFKDIVKHKPSQIIIQNIFITNGQEATVIPGITSPSQSPLENSNWVTIVNGTSVKPDFSFVSTSVSGSVTEPEQQVTFTTPYSNNTQEQQLAAPFVEVTEPVSSFTDYSTTDKDHHDELTSPTTFHELKYHYTTEQPRPAETLPLDINDFVQFEDVVGQLLNEPTSSETPSTTVVTQTRSPENPEVSVGVPSDETGELFASPANTSDSSYKMTLYPPSHTETRDPESVSQEIPKPFMNQKTTPPPVAFIVTTDQPAGSTAMYVIVANNESDNQEHFEDKNSIAPLVIEALPAQETEKEDLGDNQLTGNTSVVDENQFENEEVVEVITELTEKTSNETENVLITMVESPDETPSAVSFTEGNLLNVSTDERHENSNNSNEDMLLETSSVYESQDLSISQNDNHKGATEYYSTESVTTSTQLSDTSSLPTSLASIILPPKKQSATKTPGVETSLAALILAHTAALMAGKPSPFTGSLSNMASRLPVSQKTSPSSTTTTTGVPTATIDQSVTPVLSNDEDIIEEPFQEVASTQDSKSDTEGDRIPEENLRAEVEEETVEAPGSILPQRLPETEIVLRNTVIQRPPEELPLDDNQNSQDNHEVSESQVLHQDLSSSSLSITEDTGSILEIEPILVPLETQNSAETEVDITESPVLEVIQENTSTSHSSVDRPSGTTLNLEEVEDSEEDPLEQITESITGGSDINESRDKTVNLVESDSGEEDPESFTEVTPEISTQHNNKEKENNGTQTNILEPSTSASLEMNIPGNDATKESDIPDLYVTCGGSSSASRINFVNPSFPRPDVNKGQCSFKMTIDSPNVCQIRVEFNDSRMLLPRQGFCLDQYLSVSGSVLIPGVDKFCGRNPDQHFYLDLMEPLNGKPRVVNFDITTSADGYLYRYGLIIRQIECNRHDEYRAPRGCFQYYDKPTGLIKSFNYEGGQYFSNQNYRICVRGVPGACAIALAAPEGAFGLHKVSSKKVPYNRAGVGANACRRDYLWVPGGSRDGQVTSELESKYCGAKLSSIHGDNRPRPVIARMYSNIYSMEFRSGTPRKFNAFSHGPGFRLSYTQLTSCLYNENNSSSLRTTTSKSTEDAVSAFTAEFSQDSDEQFSNRPQHSPNFPENFSEDYYDDEPETSTVRQDSHRNATLTQHLGDLLKASLWFSKLAQNATAG